EADTEVVCLVGKSWDLHVTEALRTSLEEGVAMVRDSVAFLRREGRRVFFDAEHFFDGHRTNPVFALAVLAGAEEAGAERLVLCVAAVANLTPDSHQPYVGRYAFTHKAGLHTSGVARLNEAYEHVPPEAVGNHRGVVASDLGGAATLRMKAAEFGVELGGEAVPRLLEELKRREAEGYTFEVADASLELLMRRHDGWRQPFFEVESFRVLVEDRAGQAAPAEATVKVVANG